MRHGSFAWVFASVFVAVSFQGWAASDEAALSGQAQSGALIRNQKQIQQLLDAQNRGKRVGPPDVKKVWLPEGEVPLGKSGAAIRFRIVRIELDGATVLTSREMDLLKAPYLNREIGFEDIEALVRDITNFYVKKGYIAARVSIPKQNLSGGKLRVKVSEGRIESIRVRSQGMETRLNLDMVFVRRKGRPLNVRDLEQGIDQLNRLRSVQVRLDIVPSVENAGYSVVELVSTPIERKGMVSVRYDNYSSERMGVIPTSVSVARDQLLGWNDNWTLIYSQAHRDQLRFSNSAYASVSIPYGYWLFSGSFNQFNYMNRISVPPFGFNTSGVSKTADLRADWTIDRSQSGKATLYGALGYQDISNFIEDVSQDINRRRLSSLTVGHQHVRYMANGSLSTDFSFTQGLNLLTELPADIPQTAHFRKWTVNGTWVTQIPLAGKLGIFSASWTGMASPDTLFDSDRMALGDYTTVRGYSNSPLLGDMGIYARHDLWMPVSLLGWEAPAWQWGVGLDVGAAGRVSEFQPGSVDQRWGVMAGGAFLVQYATPDAQLNLTVAAPIKWSGFLGEQGWIGYFAGIVYLL